LHQLLDLSVRNYALGEVVEKFWRDPVFPMIPSDSVARRAIFDALRPDTDGVAWELVTSDGEKLHVATPEQLALNSSEHYLRLAQPDLSGDASSPTAAGPTGVLTTTAGVPPSAPPTATAIPGPVHYRIHELELRNRSLSDREAREKLWHLLGLLADAVDPSSGTDIQVAAIKVELTAAEGSLNEIGAKAEQAGATWDIYDEDF
jgi:hypothetical protein